MMESLPRKQSLSKSYLSRSPPTSSELNWNGTSGDVIPPRGGVGGGGGVSSPTRKTGLPTVNSTRPRVRADDGRRVTASTDDEYNFDVDDDPKEKLKLAEIQVELYRRKCTKLNVCPVGAYIRNASSRVLKLGNYCLGPLGALALSVPLTLDQSMTHLYLQGNAIKAEGLKHLAHALQESVTLTHLNLNDNELGSEGASLMSKILMVNTSLESVSLAGNNFRDSDAVNFSQLLLSEEKKLITELDLSRNSLEDGAAKLFGEVLAQNEVLEVLDLSWNQIRPKGGVTLMNGLKDNPRLKRFSVARNGLGDEGCEAAAVALTNNRSVVELDLAGNRISNSGMLALAKSLKHNDTLQVLKLGDNLATGLGAQAVGEAILRSEDCAVTTLDLTNINVFDILVQEVKEFNEHAQSRSLELKHGTVSRFVLPMDELEKKFAEEFKAAHPESTQDNTHNEETKEENEKDTKKGSKKSSAAKKNTARKAKRK